jgi:DNA-binding NarL/FixJ family response regulator
MLTRRERDILYLLAQGRTDKQIARSLGLGEATVKFHVAALSETIRAARPRPVRSRAAPTGRARRRRSP